LGVQQQLGNDPVEQPVMTPNNNFLAEAVRIGPSLKQNINKEKFSPCPCTFYIHRGGLGK
jgi:hypothetical protein